MITKDSAMKSIWHILLLVPVAVNAVISLLSPAYRLLFYISSDNVYHRGPLFMVSAVMIYFYLLLGFALIIKNRRKFIRQDFLPLCFLSILPTLGGVIQMIFYGTLLMWSCSAFSLIIVYIFLEERTVHLDYLTGSWTRLSFDRFISNRIRQNDGDRFGIIYVDIDGLKRINDEYGHAEGDEALKTLIRIIKMTTRRNDIVARLGGDEFAIVLNTEDGSQDMMSSTVNRIEAALGVFNQESVKPYKLQCSFGADVFNPGSCSLEQFMHHIDVMMYNSKKHKNTT
jgi:diguanylate cyclase (GGDEF)-like protein